MIGGEGDQIFDAIHSTNEHVRFSFRSSNCSHFRNEISYGNEIGGQCKANPRQRGIRKRITYFGGDRPQVRKPVHPIISNGKRLKINPGHRTDVHNLIGFIDYHKTELLCVGSNLKTNLIGYVIFGAKFQRGGLRLAWNEDGGGINTGGVLKSVFQLRMGTESDT